MQGPLFPVCFDNLSFVSRAVSTELAYDIGVEPQQTDPKDYIGAEKWDQDEAVRAAANRELHSDVLAPAVEKLSGMRKTIARRLAQSSADTSTPRSKRYDDGL